MDIFARGIAVTLSDNTLGVCIASHLRAAAMG